MSATIEPQEFTPGEVAAIEVTATNRGGQEATVHFTSGCQFWYRLIDAKGAPVAQIPRPCTAGLTAFTLRPGESRSDSFRWAGDTWDGMKTVPLPPGAYTLIGSLEAADGDYLSTEVSVVLLPHPSPTSAWNP